MRNIILVCIAASLAGCSSIRQHTLLAEPAIVYQSSGSIGVQYINVGIQAGGNETAAMALIADSCRGKFRITGRTERAERSYVDALCM